MYNTLICQSARQPDFSYFDLAESLEQPDPETYLYSIRAGVRIAPNSLNVPQRAMDALDAGAWLQRVNQDPQAVLSPLLDRWLDSYEVIDLQTFRIVTTSPYAYFLLRLGSPLGGCIPPRELFEPGHDLADQGVGAGPFVLRPGTFQESGGAVLDANPNYYRRDGAGKQLPYLAGMDILRISNAAERRAAFVAREIYSYGATTGDEADELLSNYDVYAIAEPVYTFISFIMNVKRPPWNDARVRQAAMHAINRQEYVDLVYGGDAQANGLVHWPLGAYALPEEELEQLQAFDPLKARQLLQAATGQDTAEITVMYPGNSSIEEHDQHLPIFLQQMQAAGFQITQQPQDFTTWLTNYAGKNYDASLGLNQTYDSPEVPLDFQHSRGPTGDFSYSNGLQDPDIDAAIEQAKTVVVKGELAEAVRNVQRQIYQAGPAFLPIVSPVKQTLYWSFVKGVPHGLGSVELFLNDFWLGRLPDSDGDGCGDAQEVSRNAVIGGLRDPDNFWDFFDTPNQANARDRVVSAADLARVVKRFGTVGPPGIDPLSMPPLTGYHTAFDRTLLGPSLWNLGPPDGAVTAQDIALAVAQFGHTCV